MANLAIAPTAPLMMPVNTTTQQPATKTNPTGTPGTQTGAPITMTSPTSGIPNLPNAPLPTSPYPTAGPLPPVLPLGDPKVTLPSGGTGTAPKAPTPTPTLPTSPVSGGGGTLTANPIPIPITEPAPTIPQAPTPTPQTTSTAPASGGMAPIAPTPLPNIPTSPASINTTQFSQGGYTGPSPSSIGALSSFLQGGPEIDRVALAKDLLAQFDPLTEAGFREDLRDATGQAAGMGQLGSGMWRTGLSNIAADRSRERDAYGRQVMNAALTGSIEDFYRNVGIAQQQQGFAAEQQAAQFAQSFAQRQQNLAERVSSGQIDRKSVV